MLTAPGSASQHGTFRIPQSPSCQHAHSFIHETAPQQRGCTCEPSHSSYTRRSASTRPPQRPGWPSRHGRVVFLAAYSMRAFFRSASSSRSSASCSPRKTQKPHQVCSAACACMHYSAAHERRGVVEGFSHSTECGRLPCPLQTAQTNGRGDPSEAMHARVTQPAAHLYGPPLGQRCGRAGGADHAALQRSQLVLHCGHNTPGQAPQAHGHGRRTHAKQLAAGVPREARSSGRCPTQPAPQTNAAQGTGAVPDRLRHTAAGGAAPSRMPAHWTTALAAAAARPWQRPSGSLAPRLAAQPHPCRSPAP
jgi:hypothetical protein